MATTRYDALLAERDKLTAEGEAVYAAVESEGRDLTDDERTKIDAINTRRKIVTADIDREAERRAAAVEASRNDPGGSQLPRISMTDAVRYAADGKVVDGQGRPIEKNASGLPRLIPVSHVEVSRFESGRDLASLKPWGADTGYPFGEYLQAVHRAGSGQGTDPRLAYQAAGQGASLEVGADGGFLAPKAVSDDIVLRMYGGEILSRVDRQTTQATSVELNVVDETSRATGSRHGGVQSYWVDAGTAPTGSRPRFASQTWRPRKIASLGYATDELLADVGLIEGTMLDAFVDDQRFMVEDAVVNGTGVGQPLGLLNSTALITVAKEGGQAAATIVFENIVKMWARSHGRSRPRLVWLYNQDIEPQLLGMGLIVGTGGSPVYLPAGGLSASPFASLMGRPMIPVEYCPTLGTVGDLILVDLKEYRLIDRGDPQRATSLHVAFTTDETAFRVTYRVDGHLKWRTALTPFKGSNSQGPVVALATRS